MAEKVKKIKRKIKWYNSRKEFGFILSADGKDIFVHQMDIPKDLNLNEEDSVEYKIDKSEKGPKVKNFKSCKFPNLFIILYINYL